MTELPTGLTKLGLIVFSNTESGPLSLKLSARGNPGNVKKALRAAAHLRRSLVVLRPNVFVANVCKSMARMSGDIVEVHAGDLSLQKPRLHFLYRVFLERNYPVIEWTDFSDDPPTVNQQGLMAWLNMHGCTGRPRGRPVGRPSRVSQELYEIWDEREKKLVPAYISKKGEAVYSGIELTAQQASRLSQLHMKWLMHPDSLRPSDKILWAELKWRQTGHAKIHWLGTKRLLNVSFYGLPERPKIRPRVSR